MAAASLAWSVAAAAGSPDKRTVAAVHDLAPALVGDDAVGLVCSSLRDARRRGVPILAALPDPGVLVARSEPERSHPLDGVSVLVFGRIAEQSLTALVQAGVLTAPTAERVRSLPPGMSLWQAGALQAVVSLRTTALERAVLGD